MDSKTMLLGGLAGGVIGISAAMLYSYCSGAGGVCVGGEDEFPIGKPKEVTVTAGDGSKVPILIIRTSKTRFRATGATCTHAKVKLVNGVLNGDRLVCPSHGACFNIDSGDIEDGCVCVGGVWLML